jgi:hypothetical protein
MQIVGPWRVLRVILCVSLWFVAQAAAAQSNPVKAQITVYESPT